MPREVRAARLIMWIQAALATLELLSFLAALVLSGMPGLWVLPWPFYVVVASVLLMSPLAAGFGSRRQWVRIAGIATEAILILGSGYSLLAPVLGPSIPTLLNLVLAVIVLVKLSGSAATRWFGR
ncbi:MULTISPECIES: hypothetical protein [Streptosporangium]|uniref:CHASE2 domain-containing sensor protein n=1 Tax=Streptosporangium brasiliense TaxID=47480 RepID=A0ABT9RD33_9ACTN|nr:hypothetical protein [Streptosporangium brasiliense]MDP9867150.1 CHASE2 domain-containing sensor protein [Streptosporangium brasiliense]